jgi:RimJ/RimL family protein N-acetyltransferase
VPNDDPDRIAKIKEVFGAENVTTLQGIRDPQVREIIEMHELAWANRISGDKSGGPGSYGNLSGRDLRGENLSGLILADMDFTGANLLGVNFAEADLGGSTMKGVNAAKADFRGTSFQGADLSGAVLSDGKFGEYNGKATNMFGVHLDNANLTRADLSHAAFSPASAAGANLTGANLEGANLLYGDLRGADFTDARLKGVEVDDSTDLDLHVKQKITAQNSPAAPPAEVAAPGKAPRDIAEQTTSPLRPPPPLLEQYGMASSYDEEARAVFAAPVITPRLVIRPWLDGDERVVPDFLNADGGIFPRQYHYYAYNGAGPFDKDRVRNEVFPAMRILQKNVRLFELYIHNQTDNRIVGMIEFSRDHHGRDRVGYFVLPSERRRGYAFEAYAGCINRAVEAGFLAGNLYAHTDPDNTVSQKFLERAGFYNLGRLVVQNNQGDERCVIGFSRVLSKDEPVGP